jgi:poly-gamma-glutamate capsule biosynthesis protein CapA/YwtB (metallophosphatase superfamily)
LIALAGPTAGRCHALILAAVVVSLAGCGDGDSLSGAGGNSGQPAAEGPQRTVTIAAVGDTMLGSTPTLPPSPETYFAQVEGQLSGDIVFGNLEGTLTEVSESPKCGEESTECFAFRAPPTFAYSLHTAGFTVMNNANNHSYDFGEAGEEETVSALRRARIAQSGLPDEITVVRAHGLRVAFLGFAPYSNTASLTDLPTAAALVKKASRRADIVVCAIHAGAEGTEAQHLTGEEETYLGEDRGNPEEFAHTAIDAGADLILGAGPHVLRGMEIYRHRLIAYSLGNFSGFHNFTTEGALGQSVILHTTLGPAGGFRAGRLTSVQLIEAGQPAPDPSGAGAKLIASLSREDLGSGAVRVGSGGRLLASR